MATRIPIADLAALCSAAISMLANSACAQKPEGSRHLKERFVFTQTEAVGLENAHLVAGPNVKQAVWSPDGRYALLVREQPTDDSQADQPISFVVWDQSRGVVSETWKQGAGSAYVEDIQWLSGAPVSLVTVRTLPEQSASDAELRAGTRTLVLRIDAAHNAAQVLEQVPLDTQVFVRPCPNRPGGVLVHITRRLVPKLTADGKVVQTVQSE